jgi:hypothetical protein
MIPFILVLTLQNRNPCFCVFFLYSIELEMFKIDFKDFLNNSLYLSFNSIEQKSFRRQMDPIFSVHYFSMKIHQMNESQHGTTRGRFGGAQCTQGVVAPTFPFVGLQISFFGSIDAS